MEKEIELTGGDYRALLSLRQSPELTLALELLFEFQKLKILIEKLSLRCGITKSELKELDSQAEFEAKVRFFDSVESLYRLLKEETQE